MKIPFLDLKSTYLELKTEIDDAISSVLLSGQYILGNEVEKFESNWAIFCEAEYAVGVANGLDALYLSLLALGVKEGDEILVPSNTYIATWLAISKCGAIPIPIEPNEITHNIDPSLIEKSITSKTKVIMPVHLYGHPADLKSILEIARKYNLFVVEDAAQAHGAFYNDKRIGAHGDLVAWSFYPGKNLGAFGDAGAVTTNNIDLAEKIKTLRNYGSRIKYENEMIGINSRLDPVQAAILTIKLNHLENWNNKRTAIANKYIENLNNEYILKPQVQGNVKHAWHLFVIRTEFREIFQKFLIKNNVGTLIHYPIPPHKQKAYQSTDNSKMHLYIAERLAKEVISIPMGPHLSYSQQEMVIDVINSFKP